MIEPRQVWWTTADLAASGLPGVPETRQGVDKLAKAQGWRCHAEFARRRDGRGGGWEYSWQLLPLPARRKLLSEFRQSKPKVTQSRDEIWGRYDRLPAKTKAKAEARLTIINAVAALELTGLTKNTAITEIARAHGVSAKSIWNWFAMIEACEPHDRLAYLAPRHGVGKASTSSDVDARFYDEFKALYLRFEGPAFTDAYRDACKIATHQGWGCIGERTLRRRLERDVPRTVQVLLREGREAFDRCFASQIRSRADMHALSWVNGDFHKMDVFVQWPGREHPVRAQVCAFQDVYSSKILSWKVDLAPNAVATMHAFGELVETFGIPENCVLDNGMEFAAKSVTGGAKTRRRFKIRDDEPDGILTLLGVKVHWARVKHGQAKPVERAFGDWARTIAKDPRFAGAYVGNRPDAKPENYASKAVPHDEFIRILGERIDELNARAGRKSQMAKGRSFDDVFAESYGSASIRKATAEQRRLWLLAHAIRRLDKHNGRLRFADNFYYAPWMSEHAGKRVVMRFDPADLHSKDVYLYTLDGAYLGEAPCQVATGFGDYAAARQHAADESRRRKTARRLAAELRPVRVEDAAKRLDLAAVSTPTAPVEAKVIRPAFATRKGEAPVRKSRPVYEPNIDFEALREAQIKKRSAQQTRAEADLTTHVEQNDARFHWALGLEAELERGGDITEADRAELAAFQQTAAYRARKRYRKASDSSG